MVYMKDERDSAFPSGHQCFILTHSPHGYIGTVAKLECSGVSTSEAISSATEMK